MLYHIEIIIIIIITLLQLGTQSYFSVVIILLNAYKAQGKKNRNKVLRNKL